MATNPRKFSEKIALHTQKLAEETAAFEQIMKEVTGVARQPSTTAQPNSKDKPQNLLSISQTAYRGGSLPNVNQMTYQQGGQGMPVGMFSRSSSPRTSRNSIGPVKLKGHHRLDHAPYASPPNQSMLSSMGQTGASGGNLYSPGMYVGNYLSPPNDAPWRRANSDSALNSLMIPSVIPDSSEESSNTSNDPRDNYNNFAPLSQMGGSQSPKHHSPTGGDPNNGQHNPRDGPNLLEIIPSSVSTGSLPDLTTFNFTTPLHQPIDNEDSQLTNSPYSTSTSPISLTYSPTGGSPHPPPNNVGSNPSHVVNNQQQQQQQRSPQGQTNQHPQQQQQQHHHPQSPHPQHQSQHQAQQQQQQPLQNVSQAQQSQMMDNPLNINTSFQNFTPNENMLTAYRCPPRPSPQNSPSPFRSPSPLEGQLSAPASPAGQPQLQNSDFSYLSQQAAVLQQHFEQITMGGGMVNNSPYFYNPVPQQIQTGATAISSQQSPQHHQPQTPQTPSSIPDIIFTDFSEDRSSEQFEDMLASEAAQALREGLGPIDMDGFIMLADPDLVQLDPQAEDSFRQDRQ